MDTYERLCCVDMLMLLHLRKICHRMEGLEMDQDGGSVGRWREKLVHEKRVRC